MGSVEGASSDTLPSPPPPSVLLCRKADFLFRLASFYPSSFIHRCSSCQLVKTLKAPLISFRLTPQCDRQTGWYSTICWHLVFAVFLCLLLSAHLLFDPALTPCLTPQRVILLALLPESFRGCSATKLLHVLFFNQWFIDQFIWRRTVISKSLQCGSPPPLSAVTCRDGASDVACDCGVQIAAPHTDNKDPIWIMLLISLGTGPFSVGACPWSLCTAAKDKHTLDTSPVIHHRARRKGTRRPRQMCLFFLSFHLPWLDISSCGESQRPSQENKSDASSHRLHSAICKESYWGKIWKPCIGLSSWRPFVGCGAGAPNNHKRLGARDEKHSSVQFVSQLLDSRCLRWFTILPDMSQFPAAALKISLAQIMQCKCSSIVSMLTPYILWQ